MPSSSALEAWENEYNEAPDEQQFAQSAQIPAGNYRAVFLKYHSHDTKEGYPVVSYEFQVQGSQYENAILIITIFVKQSSNIEYMKTVNAKLGVHCKLSEIEQELSRVASEKPLCELKVAYSDWNGEQRQTVYLQKLLSNAPATTRPASVRPQTPKLENNKPGNGELEDDLPF